MSVRRRDRPSVDVQEEVHQRTVTRTLRTFILSPHPRTLRFASASPSHSETPSGSAYQRRSIVRTYFGSCNYVQLGPAISYTLHSFILHQILYSNRSRVYTFLPSFLPTTNSSESRSSRVVRPAQKERDKPTSH